MLNGGNEMDEVKDIRMEYEVKYEADGYPILISIGYLFFYYYVEGEDDQTLEKKVAEFEIRHKRLKLTTVNEPEYLDYCRKTATAWVKENKDVL